MRGYYEALMSEEALNNNLAKDFQDKVTECLRCNPNICAKLGVEEDAMLDQIVEAISGALK